jgi:signal transduction histidine kinase
MRGRWFSIGAWTIFSLLAAWEAGLAAQTNRPIAVLILFSGPAYSDMDQRFLIGFKEEFRRAEPSSPAPYRLYVEYLGLGQASDLAGTTQEWRQLLQRRYSTVPLDAVVTVGEPALTFLQANPDLLPKLPVIFAGVPQNSPTLTSLPAEFSGSTITWDIEPTLELALKLLPDSRNVAVISGASRQDQWFADLVRREVGRLKPPVRLIDLKGLNWGELSAAISSLPPKTFIVAAVMWTDREGRAIDMLQALRLGSGIANSPVFTFNESTFGYGTVGGRLFDFAAVGADAARRLGAMTAGQGSAPGGVGDVRSAVTKVDARELKRWGIPESRVPDGVEVHFREPNVWRDYRKQVLTAVGIILALSTLLLMLLVERHRRQAAERDARVRALDLARLQRVATMGQLSASLAHEIKQPLGAVSNYAEGAGLYLKANPVQLDRIAAALEGIRQDARRATEVIERVRRMFQPAEGSFASLDLVAIVRDTVHLVESEADRRNVRLKLDLPPRPVAVRGDAVQLQQVLLNLLTNAIDASESEGAATVMVSLRENGDQVDLAVSDTGRGIGEGELSHIFKPFFTTKQQGMGIGLTVVRSMVEAHGGKVVAERSELGGARLKVSIPAGQAEADA